MKPIGPLMWEHRLIERMLRSVEKMTARIDSGFDPVLVDTIVDFIRIYADRTHHGKEEDILFRDMKKKPLSAEHERIMNELIEEHVFARKTVGRLVKAKEDFLNGNAGSLTEMTDCLKTLTEFYPGHIEKEDKHFFFPVMEYFSKDEQDAMLSGFYEFDRNMIHEKYNKVADAVEKSVVNP
ncbi:MAG TPA: hemerythrin domain-containing protein [Desulfomonilia bacterium]